MRFEWGLFNGGLHLVYVSENGAGEALFFVSDSGWYARALLIENKGVSEGFNGVDGEVIGKESGGNEDVERRWWREGG